jgi:hypothetical protein
MHVLVFTYNEITSNKQDEIEKKLFTTIKHKKLNKIILSAVKLQILQ